MTPSLLHPPPSSSNQANLAGVRSLLASGDYFGAWKAAETQMSGREAWLARCEILFRGGDPPRALAAARSGLKEAPGDLDLLYWATNASIWLGDGDSTQFYLLELEASVEKAMPVWTPSEAEAWTRAKEDFSASSLALTRHDQALENAVSNARWLCVGSLLAVVLVATWATRSGYGRSSRPVS